MLEVELLEAFEELPQELRPPLLKVVRAIQRVVGESVKRDDFLELKAVVGELAEAQRRTEERLDELAQRVDQLAVRMDELAEAQRRTEERLGQLTVRVDQLAEAQRETERRLGELAQRMDQLTEAHAETRERLESMSDAVGYELENKSYRYLPSLLERDFGIQLEGRLLRKYLPGTKKGRYVQVNIYGWGKKNGRRVLVLGEAKTSLSKKEVNRFLKHVELVSSLEGVKGEDVVKVAVVHTVVPDVEAYAQEKGVKVYWSYDLV